MRDFHVGYTINTTYEITAELDSGGMGRVFKAVNIEDRDEIVAIKVIQPEYAADPEYVEALRNEARVLRTLKDEDAIVKYISITRDEASRALCLVMEFIEGKSLERCLKGLEFNPADLSTFIRTIAEAMQAAHDKNLVHCDLSPDNILLENGELTTPVIIDFGIAYDRGPDAKNLADDNDLGKDDFMAPEQWAEIHGKPDARTDIYALGLVILAICGGRIQLPVYSEGGKPKERVFDMSAVDAWLLPLLKGDSKADPSLRQGMLAYRQADRIQSMSDVAVWIDRHADEQADAPARPSGRRGTRKRPINSIWYRLRRDLDRVMPRWPLFVGAAAVILAVSVVVALWPHKARPPEQHDLQSASTSVSSPLRGPTPEGLRVVLNDALDQLAQDPEFCGWIDIKDIHSESAENGQVNFYLEGVTNNMSAVKGAVMNALRKKEWETLVGYNLNNNEIAAADSIGSDVCQTLRTFMNHRSKAKVKLVHWLDDSIEPIITAHEDGNYARLHYDIYVDTPEYEFEEYTIDFRGMDHLDKDSGLVASSDGQKYTRDGKVPLPGWGGIAVIRTQQKLKRLSLPVRALDEDATVDMIWLQVREPIPAP